MKQPSLVGPLVPFTRGPKCRIDTHMNLRSTLSLSTDGVELRSDKGHSDAGREPLRVNRLEHLLANNPGRRPARPLPIGNRYYLRALRAAESRAWELS